VAKLLGLGYPGGPAIDRIAREGDEHAVRLPRPRFTHVDRNPPPPDWADAPPAFLPEFSFSGLKTAVLRHLEKRGVPVVSGPAGPEESPLPRQEIADIAASFQRVVVQTLVDRTFEAARRR